MAKGEKDFGGDMRECGGRGKWGIDRVGLASVDGPTNGGRPREVAWGSSEVGYFQRGGVERARTGWAGEQGNVARRT